jgi:drug/metabolite transporter (DMT)-like permease
MVELTANTPSDQAPMRGLVCMVISCVLFSFMGVCVYAAQVREPAASPLATSFFRILINLFILIAWAGLQGNWQELLGDKRPSLWWRGIFGTTALICSFTSIKAIGVGESSFLHASNGVFVATMAPLFLKQKNDKKARIAIFGALVGLFFLFEPRLTDGLPYGRALALAAGFFSALAYIMIARAGRSNSPNCVIFYFCITATVVHCVLFLFIDTVWPTEPLTWLLLFAIGVLGSMAQVFLTMSYQRSPAALNSAVSYLQPVLNMIAGIIFFAVIPDNKAFLGAAIVFVFGVALPFVRMPHRKLVRDL